MGRQGLLNPRSVVPLGRDDVGGQEEVLELRRVNRLEVVVELSLLGASHLQLEGPLPVLTLLVLPVHGAIRCCSVQVI